MTVDLNSTQLLYYVIEHYIRYNFTPLNIEFRSNRERIKYMYENALSINLGKNVDHVELCLSIAASSPYYGVILPNSGLLRKIRKYYRSERFGQSRIPTTVQSRIKRLPANTEVLLIMNASNYKNRLTRTLTSWTTKKPLLLIG